jgi:hypothetical protein
MPLSNRLQILLDDERARRLELRARETGASVGSLVRDAIDIAYPGVQSDRERAAAEILAAPPMAVGDWSAAKRELGSMWKPA